MDLDEGRVTTGYGGATRTGYDGDHDKQTAEMLVLEVQKKLRDFICVFRRRKGYPYLEALKDNVHLGRNYLEVNLADLAKFDEPLAALMQDSPGKWIPVFEAAAREAANVHDMFGQLDSREIQIQLVWNTDLGACLLREIQALKMGALCAVPGIVVKCSTTKQKVIRAVLQCTSCKSEIKQVVPANASFPQMPTFCETNTNGTEKCRPNPYIIRPDKSEFINTQYLKLQELPESVPTGELPRHIEVQVDRELVSKVNPGQRIVVIGINSIFRDAVKEKGRQAVGIRRRYLKGVGLMAFGAGNVATSVNGNFSSLRPTGTLLWNVEQERVFKELAARDNLLQDLADSLAPSIYGHEDIKKATACQLFGGTRKLLADGGKLRGDMNILLIGDPSTAKSQLLKAVHSVAPIGVYTSGKGSSAAGLTAAVTRERDGGGRGAGGFFLEGGSMVLADGGIVCIDEFDKMRQEDTVAIHEAMEQQTISVAKAGLSTVLNSRTSVLAAANPTMGCYDPVKSNEDQMNFKSTIISRFDLVFKVLDPADKDRDYRIASHVLGLHEKGSRHRDEGAEQSVFATTFAGMSDPNMNAAGTHNDRLVSPGLLKSFVAYVRAQVTTKLDAGAEECLKDFYVKTRKDANDIQKGEDKSIIKITVRQLESLVRLTESLAKMRCQPYATAEDAKEAIRMYNVATVDAIKSGVVQGGMSEDQAGLITDLELKIQEKVPMGSRTETRTLTEKLVAQGYDEGLVDQALYVMTKRGVMEYSCQKRYIRRKGAQDRE